ncbi:response regulator transcription factor [Eubacterium callanderi]|uniref:Stage 0 sporulation protein A homolog n=1 Tax=Eubacterium callanderi TaxID=53442 RepID=A0A853JME3_9FIRM|nr:response regulator transcription factor [Eubacterium callanderi]GFZ23699.1 DNA-binding response regulator [[Clostridium] methoxybenzovorans]
MRIMIIEDDPKIRQELSEFLNRYGYDPVFPVSFKHITTSILANPPDLILLDINLPVYDGYYICREIRKQSDVPIIIVTSRDSEFDELMSMNLGADDYITKPYNTQILLARIASVLKRANPSSGSTTMSHNGLTLDLSRSVIQSARGETELTKNEVGILRLLLSHKNEIVSREAIMNALWQSDAFVDDNTLTVNINRLRRKISEIGLKDYLVTKRGQGYMV